VMDRVLMHRGQPQIHGTQYLFKDGVLTLWTVRASRSRRKAPRLASNQRPRTGRACWPPKARG
jgi:hypothetical protein